MLIISIVHEKVISSDLNINFHLNTRHCMSRDEMKINLFKKIFGII